MYICPIGTISFIYFHFVIFLINDKLRTDQNTLTPREKEIYVFRFIKRNFTTANEKKNLIKTYLFIIRHCYRK